MPWTIAATNIRSVARGAHQTAAATAVSDRPAKMPNTPRAETSGLTASITGLIGAGGWSASQLPAAMPTSVAASVTSAKTPLACERRAAGTDSGIVPITLGARSAAWQPMTATVASSAQSPAGSPRETAPDRTPHATAPAAAATMTISAALHHTMTDRLGNRSASHPASHASNTNGSTKPAVPRVSTSATSPPATAFLPSPIASQRNTLSLTTVSARAARTWRTGFMRLAPSVRGSERPCSKNTASMRIRSPVKTCKLSLKSTTGGLNTGRLRWLRGRKAAEQRPPLPPDRTPREKTLCWMNEPVGLCR